MVVGCGLSAGASAADTVPVKLPEAVVMNSNVAAGPKTVAGPTVVVPATAGSTAIYGDAGCATGTCNTKHGHKGVMDGKLDCACVPAPIVLSIGTWTREAFDRQSSNASAEYFVLFREEWVIASAELHPGGQRHLHRIIRQLGGTYPAVP